MAPPRSHRTSLTFSCIGLYRFEFLPTFCPVSRLYTLQAVPSLSQGGAHPKINSSEKSVRNRQNKQQLYNKQTDGGLSRSHTFAYTQMPRRDRRGRLRLGRARAPKVRELSRQSARGRTTPDPDAPPSASGDYAKHSLNPRQCSVKPCKEP